MSNYQKYLKYKNKYLKYKNKYNVLQNQLGGELTPEDIIDLKQSYTDCTCSHQKKQIQYCISQMKRFAICMISTDGATDRKYQLFYTLGRIQELLNSKPTIWWNPFESMIISKDYTGIDAYIDVLCEAIGCGYDNEIISKGC